MSASDREFEYVSKLHGRQIRLLTILPSNTGDICCSVAVQSLDKQIPYIALSYVWGDPISQQRITCDGRALEVTENLYQAIQHLKRKQLTEPLWIDAICINQRDNQEKTYQVQMMRDIYREASRVIVWLGKEEQTDRLAYALIRRIVLAFEEFPPGMDYVKLPPGLPAVFYDPQWEYLRTFFNKPWFSRIWVVQELLMAKKSSFMCGTLEMETEALLLAAYNVKHCHEAMLSVQRTATSEEGVTMNNILDFSELWLDWQNGRRFSLWKLVCILRNFKATDKRDMLFALVGLTDVDTSFIDYSKDPSHLLMEFTLEMLQNGTTEEPSFAEVLSMTLSCRHDPSLPSWCLNLPAINARLLPFSNLAQFSKGIVQIPTDDNVGLSAISNQVCAYIWKYKYI